MSDQGQDDSRHGDLHGGRMRLWASGLGWMYGALVLAMFAFSLASLGLFVAGLVMGGLAGVELAHAGGVLMKISIGTSAVAVALGILRTYAVHEHKLTL